MKYIAPATMADILASLRDLGPAARILAGGQDLVPLMNQGRLSPDTLVDIRALRNSAGIRRENGSLHIHALTTHTQIETSHTVQRQCGLLAEAASQIGGGLQVRNRGTIGGAVCSGSPVYDFAPCLVALDGRFRAQRLDGERWIAASGFFRDAGVTDLKPNELLTEIAVPAADSRGFAYEKLKFLEGCYCISSAACVLSVDGEGRLQNLRLALGGVEPVPTRLTELESKLTGQKLDDRMIAAIPDLVAPLVRNPLHDVQADADYRRSVAGVLVGRALKRAFRRAAGRELA